MRKFWFALLLIVPLALAACGGDDGGEDTPPSDTPTATPVTPTLGPPTWTPAPEGFRPSATPRPTATPRPDDDEAGESDLPPTWTPPPTRAVATSQGSGNTGEDAIVRNPDATPKPTFPTATPQPDWCYELIPISEDFRIQAGQPVTLTWESIPQMERFLVEVRHPGGFRVFSDITTENSYQVPGDTFQQAVAYGWQVLPLAEDGTGICFPISGEIVVTFD